MGEPHEDPTVMSITISKRITEDGDMYATWDLGADDHPIGEVLGLIEQAKLEIFAELVERRLQEQFDDWGDDE